MVGMQRAPSPSLLSSHLVKGSTKLVLFLIVLPWLLTYLHLTHFFKRESFLLVTSSPSERRIHDAAFLPDGIYTRVVQQVGSSDENTIECQRVWQSQCCQVLSGGGYDNAAKDDPFCNSFDYPSIVQLSSQLLPLVKSRARLIAASLGFHSLLSDQTVFRLSYNEDTNQWLFLMDQPKLGTVKRATLQLASYSHPTSSAASTAATTKSSSFLSLQHKRIPPSGIWVQDTYHQQQEQQQPQQQRAKSEHRYIQVNSFQSYFGMRHHLPEELSTLQMSQKTIESPSTLSSSSTYAFRRNPNKKGGNGNSEQGESHSSPLWTLVTEFPATTFWLVLNIGLYLVFWNQNVSAASVALNHQVWTDHGRAFSGALSHFEIWHIGFNMMSLHTLGQELEPIYGSIPFFLYNFSLIPITTLIELGMMIVQQRYQERRQQRQQLQQQQAQQEGQVYVDSSATAVIVPIESLPNHNIVGYSGVLFAWMVVATLQPTRGNSCPIPFVPSLCFQTFSFLGGAISFNLGPFVTLVFAQVILPRSAFIGHLAGIVAGFAIHWKLLPLEYLAQPALLIPAIWMYSKLWRQEHCFTCNTLRHSGWGTSDRVSGAIPSFATHRGLQWVRRTMTVLLLFASILVPPRNLVGTVLPHLFLWIILECMLCWMATEVDCLNHEQLHEYNRVLGVIGRGLVVALLVVMITDAMTLSGWFVTSILWQSPRESSALSTTLLWLGQEHARNRTAFILPVVVSVRLLLLLLTLCLTCHILANANEIGTNDTIFVRVVGWCVLEPAQQVGSRLLSRKVEAEANVLFFPGRGVSLGGGGGTSRPTTRSVNRRGESSSLTSTVL
jgi:membrane associated rhomboid family serine protease